MEEDPEFAEFLKIHDVNANRGATWGNDGDNVTSAQQKTEKSGGESEERYLSIHMSPLVLII